MTQKKSTSTTRAAVGEAGVSAFASPDLSEAGQGLVLIARPKGSASADVVTFLVDVHCLGVRKVTLSKVPLKALLDDGLSALRVVPISASEARGIVEGVVAFSKKLGFSAPDNLIEGLAVFGGIAPQKPPFDFGKSGRPFYTQQRGDDEDFVEIVLARLAKSCGESGFGYLLDGPSEDWLDGEGLDSAEDEGGEE
ncbi:MAG: hypothetical protein LBD01_00390 [Puniceicoccales bacterium]|jgi:hypothetical protein|nr:hypothetical protein [Puniceicoccales bacterium]